LGITSLILFLILSFAPHLFLKSGGYILATSSEVFKRSSDQFLLNWQKGKIEPPDLSIIQENSLLAASPSIALSPKVLGDLVGDFGPETKKEIVEYVVQPNDTLWQIAENFGISLNTLLWANDLNKNSTIQPGQKLIILPVSGVIHHVKSGDTLSEIARLYKGNVDEIIAFNDLSGDGDIFVGDILIIPNGVIPPAPAQPAPNLTPLASSYFICPIPLPCKITQGLHWYNAVDFSHGNCGEPIYAAAQGTVLKTKYGWNGGAGNSLTILHPNGVVTMYGHLQTILVSPGQTVSQGQMIALMGGQPGTPGAGRSTGCHLHFGVSGARNPFAR
jgi:LysM repeat protein/biotin carboxyl carrier protein